MPRLLAVADHWSLLAPVLALQAADVRIVGAQRAVHAALAPGDQIQGLLHRRHCRLRTVLRTGDHLLQQAHRLAAVFQWQRRCRPGRCIELVSTAGLGRIHAGIQRRAIGGLAGQLPADHAGQSQAFAAGHRLGNLLVVHLAEHLVLAGKQRVAEAGVTHALTSICANWPSSWRATRSILPDRSVAPGAGRMRD